MAESAVYILILSFVSVVVYLPYIDGNPVLPEVLNFLCEKF